MGLLKEWFLLAALGSLISQSFGKAPPGYVKKPDHDKHPPKYEYGYDIKDGRGGRQGHLETRDGEFALGLYYVDNPGSGQNVQYFVDDWGYHPLVTYGSTNAHGSSRTQFAMGERAVKALKNEGAATALGLTQQSSPQNIGLLPVQSGVQVLTAALPTVQPVEVVTPQSPTVLVPVLQQRQQVPNVIITSNGAIPEGSTATYQHSTESSLGANQYGTSAYQQGIDSSSQTTQAQGGGTLYINHAAPITGPVSYSPLYHQQTSPASSASYQVAGSSALESGHTSLNIQQGSIYQTNKNTYLPKEYSNEQNYASGGDVAVTDGASNVRITAYVADTNSAIPFGTKLSQNHNLAGNAIQSVTSSSVEQESNVAYNEIRKEEIISVTPTPAPLSYSTLRPIVITNQKKTQEQVEIVSPSPIVYSSSTSQATPLYASSSADSSSSYSYSSSASGLDSTNVGEDSSLYISTPRPLLSYSVASPSPQTIIVTPRPQISSSVDVHSQAGLSLVSSQENVQSHYSQQPIIVPEQDVKRVPQVVEEVDEVTARAKTFVEIQKSIPLRFGQQQSVGENQVLIGYNQGQTTYSETQTAKYNEQFSQNQEILQSNLAQQEYNSGSSQIRDQVTLVEHLPQPQSYTQEEVVELENHIRTQYGKKLRIDESVSQNQHNQLVEEVSAAAQAKSDYSQQSSYSQERTELDSIRESHQHFYESLKQANLGQYLNNNAHSQIQVVQLHNEAPTVVEVEKPVPVPVEIEKPIHIESTKIVEVEKPVPVYQPVAVERTKFVEVEKPVHVEHTKLVAVDRPVPIPHLFPVEVTKLVAVDRPVPYPKPYAVPHPFPVPYAVPHPVRIPVHHYVPYPHVVAVPYREYQPIYINGAKSSTKTSSRVSSAYRKESTLGSSLKTRVVYAEQAPVRSRPSYAFHSGPSLHLTPSSSRALSVGGQRSHPKKLCIEYGGFRPPMVPSTQIEEDPEPNID